MNNHNLIRGKGRPAGSVNKVQSDVREMIKNIFEKNIHQMELDFQQLKPEARISTMLKMASLILPTLKPSDIEHIEKPIFKTINLDVNSN